VPPPCLNVTQANGRPVKMAELRNPLAQRGLRWPGVEYETDHLSFFHCPGPNPSVRDSRLDVCQGVD
jgi:hypothetical protein